MPETGKEQSKSIWPLVKFQFLVTIGTTEAFFQEVTGLNTETQQIEYRNKNNREFSTIKMPGIQKFGNVTLKKGIFKDDKNFWDMYDAVKMNVPDRKTISISLLDEAKETVMSWELANAYPIKITSIDMKKDTGEAAVESMELVHEGLTVRNK